METGVCKKCTVKEKKFKSYYVVWKHRSKLPLYCLPCVFKSYYVVWKPLQHFSRRRWFVRLNRTMQYGNEDTLSLPQSNVCGLNRTMQYGNENTISPNIISKGCLNRTMQYGNVFPSKADFSGLICLNRTMQYGNWLFGP